MGAVGYMIKEKSAGAIIYRLDEEGNIMYLLLQAAPGKPWGFPKGKLDPGETEEEAARREINEEAGLSHFSFEPDFRHAVQYNYRRGRELIKKEVTYFLARTESAEVHISWEHVAYQWAPMPQAFELVHYENARELFRKAHRYLEKRLNSLPN